MAQDELLQPTPVGRDLSPAGETKAVSSAPATKKEDSCCCCMIHHEEIYCHGSGVLYVALLLFVGLVMALKMQQQMNTDQLAILRNEGVAVARDLLLAQKHQEKLSERLTECGETVGGLRTALRRVQDDVNRTLSGVQYLVQQADVAVARSKPAPACVPAPDRLCAGVPHRTYYLRSDGGRWSDYNLVLYDHKDHRKGNAVFATNSYMSKHWGDYMLELDPQRGVYIVDMADGSKTLFQTHFNTVKRSCHSCRILDTYVFLQLQADGTFRFEMDDAR